MRKRRNLLLAVLIGLCGVWAYDNRSAFVDWIEREEKPDYGAMTVEQLLAARTFLAYGELQRRAWDGGPAAVAAALEHEDADVRTGVVTWLRYPDPVDAKPEIVAQWSDWLLRVVADHADPDLRNRAVFAFAMLVREELVREVPEQVLSVLRQMLAGDQHARALACMSIMHMGRSAQSLRDNLLAVDLKTGEAGKTLAMLACTALGNLGKADAASVRYLLGILANPRSDGRDSAALALGAAGADVEDVRNALWRVASSEGEERAVRSAAMGALAQFELPSELASELVRLFVATEDWFESYELGDWASTLVAVAIRADTTARDQVKAVLARLSRDGLEWEQEIVAAGSVRIAVVERDERVLGEALPGVLEGLTACEEELRDSIWMREHDERRPVFEALVEVCEWQGDDLLRKRTAAALELAETTQPSWVRKWCRPLLARLRD